MIVLVKKETNKMFLVFLGLWLSVIIAWFVNLFQAIAIIKIHTISTMTILMWIKIIGIPLGYGAALGFFEILGII